MVVVRQLTSAWRPRELPNAHVEVAAQCLDQQLTATEEPCRQLLQAPREGTPLDDVENLTWKREDGSVVVNPLTFVPADLDCIDVPASDFMLHAVFTYLEGLRYPSTLLLNSRGCPCDCAICGGSRSAYRDVAGRSQSALRSAEKLVADAADPRHRGGAPVVRRSYPRSCRRPARRPRVRAPAPAPAAQGGVRGREHLQPRWRGRADVEDQRGHPRQRHAALAPRTSSTSRAGSHTGTLPGQVRCRHRQAAAAVRSARPARHADDARSPSQRLITVRRSRLRAELTPTSP